MEIDKNDLQVHDAEVEGTTAAIQDRRNALLNVGYAVMWAGLARACVASGLLPAFGIHHASRSNAFNLEDDLIEPFRPARAGLPGPHLPKEGSVWMPQITDK